MTPQRFALLLLLALGCEVGVFAVSYPDLLFLRRPVDQLLSGPQADFTRRAEQALSRTRLTGQHLETIAATAQGFGMTALEVRALERLTAARPLDLELRLRFADALRRGGEYDRAERLYVEVLAARPVGTR